MLTIRGNAVVSVSDMIVYSERTNYERIAVPGLSQRYGDQIGKLESLDNDQMAHGTY